jgi:hypothetical protein
MKKIYFLITLLICFNGYTQDIDYSKVNKNTISINSNIVDSAKFQIELNIGIPGIRKLNSYNDYIGIVYGLNYIELPITHQYFFSNSKDYTEFEIKDHSAFGPIAFNLMYKINKYYEIGLNLNYSYRNEDGKYADWDLLREDYILTKSSEKIPSFMLINQINLKNNSNYKFFLETGLGLSYVTFNRESFFHHFYENWNESYEKINHDYFKLIARLGIGASFYLNQQLGLNFGAGIGRGGIFKTGLSYRF